MYRLIDITYSGDKESQAYYNYESLTQAMGEFETKVGSYLKSEAIVASILMVLDNVGNVVTTNGNTLFNTKGVGGVVEEGAEPTGYEFKPRLIEINTFDTGEETTDISKYDNDQLVETNFHSKWGAAIKNGSMRAKMLKGINGVGSQTCYTYWVRPIEE